MVFGFRIVGLHRLVSGRVPAEQLRHEKRERQGGHLGLRCHGRRHGGGAAAQERRGRRGRLRRSSRPGRPEHVRRAGRAARRSHGRDHRAGNRQRDRAAIRRRRNALHRQLHRQDLRQDPAHRVVRHQRRLDSRGNELSAREGARAGCGNGSPRAGQRRQHPGYRNQSRPDDGPARHPDDRRLHRRGVHPGDAT